MDTPTPQDLEKVIATCSSRYLGKQLRKQFLDNKGLDACQESNHRKNME